MLPGSSKLLFFGSDGFSIRVLGHILRKGLCPVKVVTKTGSPLYEYSKQNGLENFSFSSLCDTNGDNSHNIGIVASFGELIDVDTINRFKYGLFNVHPSLLPKFRGSSPVQAAILHGLHTTGCTIMKIPPIARFDIGDIVIQRRLSIKKREYAYELMDRLADLGGLMVEQLLTDYENNVKLTSPQTDEDKSYARKMKPEHGLLRFRSETSELIDRKVRAYTRFIKLYTYCTGGMKVFLGELRDPDETEGLDLNSLVRGPHGAREARDCGAPPGTIYLHKPRKILSIKCVDNRWLSFDQVKPEHHEAMNSLDFYNGFLSKLDPEQMMTDV